MENIFVKTNPLNGDLSINYVEVNNMMKSLNRAIINREDYFNWVKEWKIRHENLVGAIQGLRSEKQHAKFELNQSKKASDIQIVKLSLRPFARELYKLRTENKDRFKAGEFGTEIGYEMLKELIA